jgi:hypothetical protein
MVVAGEFATREDDVANYVMAVYSNAQPGRDADYMNWYENVHVKEICTIKGVTEGHVYQILPTSPAKPNTTYMAIYELDVDDPMSVMAEIGRKSQAGEMTMTDAIDAASAQITLYKKNF